MAKQSYKRIFDEVFSHVGDEIDCVEVEASETVGHEVRYLHGYRDALKWVQDKMYSLEFKGE